MKTKQIQEPPVIADALWDKKQTARFLGVSHYLIDRWTSRGNGPRHIKINNHLVRFRPEDVRDFIESQARGGNVAT
jgi:predicted DNA-binding transcriptional regulator AlpA